MVWFGTLLLEIRSSDVYLIRNGNEYKEIIDLSLIMIQLSNGTKINIYSDIIHNSSKFIHRKIHLTALFFFFRLDNWHMGLD